MTGRRMDWRKARLVGKPSLDFRREFEFEDRAALRLEALQKENDALKKQLWYC